MRKMLTLGLGAVASLAALSVPASAAIILTDNPSFENGTNSSEGWTFSSGAGVFSPAKTDIVVDGANAAFANAGFFDTDLGTMVAGQTYSLTMGYGYRTDGTPAGTGFQVFLREDAPAGGSTTLSYGYGSTAATSFNGLAGTPFTVTPGTLTYNTLSYTATPADDGKELFYVVQGNTQIVADNISLVTTPEPATLGVLAIGALGLLRRRPRA